MKFQSKLALSGAALSLAATVLLGVHAPEAVAAKSKAKTVYFKNCTAAKKAGYYNIKRGDPGYRKALDRDNDGIACEK
ncbi:MULTISPECIES: excalibur calcium-binding domain-containing protein [Paenibacillus]|uniref:excalibur calcium-binding domain-containing protein n=1 Tax=Paenibacillus TaxID=44249 RepID=UPI0008397938|nr:MULTISPECIES: excalibur calcium-binding domain-containing protein [Paenibacillus]GIP21157.1 hypothetical protein J22TS3_14320 [Paenibacillus sp. J22TS3]